MTAKIEIWVQRSRDFPFISGVKGSEVWVTTCSVQRLLLPDLCGVMVSFLMMFGIVIELEPVAYKVSTFTPPLSL